MGIQNPVLITSKYQEFRAPAAITAELQTLIYNQDPDLSKANQSLIQMSKSELRIAKVACFKGEHNAIMTQLPKSRQRALEQAATKGASSWLSALPLKSHGFCQNKSEFVEGIALRYNWPIQNVHSHCVCGKKNDGDYVQVCKLGGYVKFGHNALRDAEADFLKEICRDV
jgi:hypothetical protein